MCNVLNDARRLSSGTLATLIDRSDYATIDKVNAAFLACLEPIAKTFFTWQCAWLEFAKSGRLCAVLGITQPSTEEINAGWDRYLALLSDEITYARGVTNGYTKPIGNDQEWLCRHNACRQAHNDVHALHRLRGDDSREIEAALASARLRGVTATA